VGRAERIAVALAGLGIFAIYAWAGRYWIDLTDEGYFLYLASRVHQGDLPYRDFETYYTPGIFYLYAATFELFGVSIVPVRVLMAGLRAVCAVLLYGITRRVAAWPFAVLPFLLIAAVDPTPVFPEPHPAWPAMVTTLLTMETIARHATSGRLRWMALAGASAGLAFFFKQNVGAFVALAVSGYLLLRPRGRVGRLVLAAQALYAAGLGLAITLFLRPGLDGLLAVTIWLPALATLALLLRRAWAGAHPDGWTLCLGAIAAEGALAGALFMGMTLLWLVPLAAALGPRETPFGLFVGAVNQGALILPLEPPPRSARELALVAIWLPLGLGLLAGAAGRREAKEEGRSRLRPITAMAVMISLLVPWMPTVTGPWEPLTEDPSFYPWLSRLDAQLGTLYLYLPALGAWAGLAALARGLEAGNAGLGSRDRVLPWYLLVGAIAALAMYPRADTLHAMFAGPPLFVVGAWALSRTWGALAAGAGPRLRAALFAALLVVPVAAVAPHAYWRYVTIIHSDPRSPTPPPYVPLALERAQVLAPRHLVESVRGAVDFVRAGTAAGEPFFAYPAVPLFNFLADRPNPTRFGHFLPGALTPEDLVEVIGELETARPRYVLWDHGGVVYWHVETANTPLSDYIWRCYAQVASFTPYLILERRGC
jgi:Dolichyl-phosphate-mannose-protein mannosyltransferase